MLAAITLLLATPAFAHPLGEQSVDRYSQVEISAGKVVVVYAADAGEVATFQEMQRLDTNGDGVVDDSEKQMYADAQARALAPQLHLEINGNPLALEPATAKAVLQPGQGTLPTLLCITTVETAPGALAAALHGTGTQAGTYRDDNEPHRTGFRQIAIRGLGVKIMDQSVEGQPAALSPQGYVLDRAGNQSDVRRVDFHFAPVVSAATSPGTSAPTSIAPRERSADSFATLLTARHLTMAKMWWLLIIAAGLGGLHALAPGHGKTLVAAYLVGSRGTAWHALYLGLIVTFTHTAGVFALGLVTLFASRYLLPETLYPWLTAASGLVIAQVGLFRLFGRGGLHQHEHEHGHEHTHEHEHEHEREHEYQHAHGIVHAHQQIGDHVHFQAAPGHSHHHHNEGGHSDVNVDHAHSHEHHEPARHHHHLPAAGEAITWRSLLALGVSGGLVPCPSALVVLLSAVALHQIGFGLALIVAFSAGLALVLTGIGVAMVYARDFLSQRFTLPAWLPRLVPRVGAVLIIAIGLGITVPAIITLARRY